jgi:two-component system, NtrC family, nitrogen regulation response regulator GlnG
MLRTPKILIVEDDASIGVVVRTALHAEGMEVDICDSCASRNILLEQARFDLMLTDVILRDGDGLKDLERVGREYPDMPVIIMSAQNTLDTAVRASEVNAFEYFPKPFDLEELVKAVGQGVSKGRAGLTMVEEAQTGEKLSMVGRSPAMQEVYRMVARLLKNDLSVLILGESGTGKELVAEAIQRLGHRKTGPFVAINMAAIPADLIEAELFGHEKGAFTGAVGQSIGRFEQAQGGTLFLDEIGDMPALAQTRLLRALQSGTITRVGGKASIKLDVRIVAATNQNLESLIEKGLFREDLFYRLNVFPIQLPALRDRPEDIPLLAKHFLQLAKIDGLPLKILDDSALSRLSELPWKGNVRELKNFIYRLVLLSREDIIGDNHVVQASDNLGQDENQPKTAVSFEAAIASFMRNDRETVHSKGELYDRALAAFEQPFLQQVMKHSRGNQLKAAALLGINRNTLRKKLSQYGLIGRH